MLSQWLGDEIGRFHQCQNRGQRRTNRCGPYALAMAANVLLGEARFDGDEVSAELDRKWIELLPYPRVNRFPRDTATLPGAMVRFLKQQGLRAGLHARGTVEQLKRAVDAGHIALPVFGQWTYRVNGRWQPWGHTMAVVGYTDQSLLALDPASPDPGLFEHPYETWLPWWRSMGRIWVDAALH